MTRHLCISVTLLDPFFHGKCDGDEPEWPPSPMRLFQALLAGERAGCHARRWSDGKADAFRWLERQPPPVIIGPEVVPAATYTLFVPNNDGDKAFKREERLTSKVVRPQRLLDGQTIHYVWPIDAGMEASAASVCEAARHILSLGWGIDQAVGEGRILSNAEVAALPGRRWRPLSCGGGSVRRVPVEGSLEDLERAYQSFVRRIENGTYQPPFRARRFAAVHYMEHTTMPTRFYAAFEFPEGVALLQERACEVAAMLRSLACRCAKADTHEFPGGSETYVAGHIASREGGTPHRFSYLVIPTIGYRHGDGLIRRVLIAEPYGGDGTHARWAQERLRGRRLTDSDGRARAELLDLWRRSSGQIMDRYTAKDREWFSVTPVILPGFDDGKHAKAEKLSLQAIAQAGLPVDAIEEVTLRKAPYHAASAHPSCYRRPHYLRHLPAWHVRLRFRDPVPGPMALGAGRHCGLGIFARGVT